MKKSILSLAALFLLLPNAVIAQNSNQSQIDELLTRKADLDKDAQTLYDRFMEEIKPIQDEALEIQNQLAELGYVTNIVETNSATYEFLNFSTVDNSMFPDEKVMTIEMNFTNKQNQPANPWTSFVVDFAVEQNLGQTTELLMGANGQMTNLEDQDAVRLGESNINPGQTVKVIIGVRLIDSSQPVQFILNSTKLSGNPEGFEINP